MSFELEEDKAISWKQDLGEWKNIFNILFLVLLKRLREGGTCFYTGIWPCFRAGPSQCVVILTEFIQQITHRNYLSALHGQHEFNNFCNLSWLILKIGGFTPVFTNHKKGVFH